MDCVLAGGWGYILTGWRRHTFSSHTVVFLTCPTAPTLHHEHQSLKIRLFKAIELELPESHGWCPEAGLPWLMTANVKFSGILVSRLLPLSESSNKKLCDLNLQSNYNNTKVIVFQNSLAKLLLHCTIILGLSTSVLSIIYSVDIYDGIKIPCDYDGGTFKKNFFFAHLPILFQRSLLCPHHGLCRQPHFVYLWLDLPTGSWLDFWQAPDPRVANPVSEYWPEWY